MDSDFCRRDGDAAGTRGRDFPKRGSGKTGDCGNHDDHADPGLGGGNPARHQFSEKQRADRRKENAGCEKPRGKQPGLPADASGDKIRLLDDLDPVPMPLHADGHAFTFPICNRSASTCAIPAFVPGQEHAIPYRAAAVLHSSQAAGP
ncbi:hypothetical protein ACEPPZ_19010 [Paracoccus yeei]